MEFGFLLRYNNHVSAKSEDFHVVLTILSGISAGFFSFAVLTPNLLKMIRASVSGGFDVLFTGLMTGFVEVPLLVISSVLLSAAVGAVVAVVVHRLLSSKHGRDGAI